MKNRHSFVRTLACKVLPVVAGLLALASTAQAASIRMEVFTQGKWVLVVPGSGTGGRVQWDPGRRCYITDRAARGELLFVTKSASTAAERANPVIYWSDLQSSGGGFPLSGGCMTATDCFQVPLNPAWDNNYIRICTVPGLFRERIPVGSR